MKYFNSLKEYNDAQTDEMQKHRWIESEKAGHDLGEAAYREWVMKYAAKFREESCINSSKQEKDG